jgi:hypothetical protein
MVAKDSGFSRYSVHVVEHSVPNKGQLQRTQSTPCFVIWSVYTCMEAYPDCHDPARDSQQGVAGVQAACACSNILSLIPVLITGERCMVVSIQSFTKSPYHACNATAKFPMTTAICIAWCKFPPT